MQVLDLLHSKFEHFKVINLVSWNEDIMSLLAANSISFSAMGKFN